MDKDIQKKLGISDKTIAEHTKYINPLSLVVTEEFNSKEEGSYRDRAIQRCIKAKVSFRSEANTLTELVKKVVQVNNPLTDMPMVCKGGGGNSDSMTLIFKDDTGLEISISLAHDAISVTFPEKKK